MRSSCTALIQLLAVADHRGEAEKAGLEMPDRKRLSFRNPRAGTPLILAAPSAALAEEAAS